MIGLSRRVDSVNRRDYVTLAGSTLLTTSLAGCSGGTDGGATGESGTGPETAASTSGAPSANVFGPETFSGSGARTTEEFQLADAPLAAEYGYEGDGGFAATLVPPGGESYEEVSLADAGGAVEGSKVANVTTAARLSLDVRAGDGDWEITLQQLPSPNVRSLPVDASGEGPTYLGPFGFDGATEFRASHSGEGEFVVSAVPLDAFGIGDVILGETGGFEGSTTARPGGPAYLDVDAGGEWTLSSV